MNIAEHCDYRRDELIRICVDYFCGLNTVDLALIYGSVADNSMNEKSDIDIAVAGRIDTDELFTIKMNIELLCRREVDIIDLSGAEGIILHRIMTKGVRVKFDENLFVHYLKKAL